jgi:hypothetical protein
VLCYKGLPLREERRQSCTQPCSVMHNLCVLCRQAGCQFSRGGTSENHHTQQCRHRRRVMLYCGVIIRITARVHQILFQQIPDRLSRRTHLLDVRTPVLNQPLECH